MKECGKCIECKDNNPSMCYDPIWTGKKSNKSKTFSTSVSYGNWDPAGGGGAHKKCAHTHPPFKITDKITVYGGAAGDPVRNDHDIYVSLDWGTTHHVKPVYPWSSEQPKHVFVFFQINDMSAPKDPVEFKNLINWLAEQATAGKSIHIGCIGGHGRTGMVLAALTKVLTGNEDAITFVRKGYCEKAVETSEQVSFLGKHFGIKAAKGTKSFGGYAGDGYGGTLTGRVSSKTSPVKDTKGTSRQAERAAYYAPTEVTVPVTPFTLKGNVWGIGT